MAEIVISIAAKVAEYLVDPILQPICYAFKYQRNMEELKKQVKKLTNERDSVQHSVDEAKRQGDEIEKQVQEWLDSVDEFVKKVVKPIIDDQVKVLKLTHERESVQHSVDEANKQGDEIEKQVQEWLNSAVVKPITDDSVKANKLCSTGFCPNPMTRYSLSKKAAKAAKDGVVLLGQGKFPKVSYRLPPQRTNSLIIKGYEDFASRMSLSERIMEALADTDNDLIGVYGMGGVGKTTLVNKVAQQAKENKLFDVVVTAVVTETPDIIKIQDQIADELGLKFQEPSVQGRAARLRERMKRENRIIVILDNIWAKLDLESIGIPIVGDEKGSITQKVHQKEGENANKKQCKIMLTSRRLDVLRDDMNIQKNFKVDVLSDPEAESLFWNTMGYSEEKSDLIPIAVEIVRKCAGLPVAIKTTANALKNKSLPIWKNALDQLKKANPKDIKGMNADVYSTIELSFNLLENEEAKSLFQFCSLCNGGYGVHITDLLKYSMGLSLFQDCYTLEEGRNKLHTLIDYLKTSCLLMDDDSDLVKMHDIIHAVAVSISSTNKLWFHLQDAAGLKDALGKKLSKDSAAVSLLNRDIYELPEKMEFPKLELFLLNMEDASSQIPDAVFEGMKGLKVLDITGIHLLSPPSSLCCLTNLRTLCLDHCGLKDVAFIGELKELEILSLLNSGIVQLPREIGQLTRLRLLDLSHSSKLQVINPNVISSLTHLEELYMGDSFDQWDIDGQRNASLAELKQLSHLTALDIHVPNARIIPQGLSFEKLERYRIFVGEVWDWSCKCETSRTLKLKLSSSIYLSNEIKSLLNRTEDLLLDKLKGVKSVVYELSGEGFPQLKHLHVQNGSDIQHIANPFGWGLCNVFPRLESLFLDNLINLEKICHAQLAPKSFSKLRIMKVRKCDRLKHLFSFSIVNNLSQLQEIEVTNCKKLEEIISKESMELVHPNESIRRIEFTQLHTLTLECLPQLTSFSFNASTPDIGSQEIVAEDEADGFMSLFSQNVVLPSLKNLKLSSINIRCTRLDQLPAISSCCRALTNLTLEECNDLKFLFSYSVVQSLVQLQKLEVRNCKSIEEIINTKELRGEKKMIKMVFPKLLNLQLKGLPKLSRFGSGNSVEFLSLTQISIEDCPKLKTFFFGSKYADKKKSNEVEEMNFQDDIYLLFDEKVELPTLASLHLSSIASQTIWHNQLQAHSTCFHNLTKLTIYDCQNLKYLFSFSVAESLNNLEVLSISNCKLMEGVIITQGERKSSTLFPKLKELKLDDLSELITFCNFNGNSIELPSLSELIIEDCPKMQTFASNSLPGIEETEEVNLPSFFDEKVSFSCLKENSQPIKVLENLAYLEVSGCDNLKTLVPSSVSLQNLETLEVRNCDALISLVTFSTATSLEQLKRMEIIDCKMIEEIIIDTGDEIKDGIVFNQLEYLKLRDLPSLTSFCKGNFTIEFPYLQRVLVIACLKMMNFSQGVLSTPKLQSLQMTESSDEWKWKSKWLKKFWEGEEDKEDKGCWEGDLNTTIQKLFRDQVGLRYIENFTVSKYPQLKEVWHEKILVSYFRNLKSLVVDDKCCSLRYIFTPSVALGLVQLRRLEIKNCVVLEVIIVIEEETISNTMFPNLNSLMLKDLPKLTCFSNFVGNSIELPSLATLSIENCPNMETFVSNFMGVDMSTSKDNCLTDHIQPLFDEKVSFSCLKKLNLSYLPKLLHLWKKNSQPRKVFENLASLEVSSCGNLKTLVDTRDEIKDGIVFEQLEYLKLRDLPSLTSFCKGNFTIEFPYLQRVLVIECLKMMNFSQGVLSTPKLQSLQMTESIDEWKWEFKALMNVEDKEDEGCWEGDLNTTIQKLFKDQNGQSSTEH